jgi:hypothetical protein
VVGRLASLRALEQRRGRLRWYQRGQREDLDAVAADWRREREELRKRVVERPRRAPTSERGIDRGIER